jgi:hypothetical protein
MGKRATGADDPNELRIDWSGADTANESVTTKPVVSPSAVRIAAAVATLAQD